LTYRFGVTIFVPGTSEPAHWGFVIYQPPSTMGDLLHVRVIDESLNLFQFEPRIPHLLASQNAWGVCKIRDLTREEYTKVARILESEVPPPRGGAKNCQDWVIDGLVALEVEELVSEGTTQTWSSRVGKATLVIKNEVSGDWLSLNGR
ncbi:uncharacterized protein BO80DRAFT_488822, partial [Aspergillus ibericus CBS 121593]